MTGPFDCTRTEIREVLHACPLPVLILWLSVIVAVFENGSPTTAATVVIASKDSLQKKRADFTCDGVDDHV